MTEISVAAALIINEDGHVLIAQRAEPEALRGLWEFPGGKVEDGESAEAAVLREIDEELNLKIETREFVGEFLFQGESLHIRIFAFSAAVLSGDLQVRDHLDVRWVPPADLAGYPLSPADIPIVPAYLALKSRP